MNLWRIYYKNEWVKLTRQPQVVWILLIAGWTLVGWAWLLGQGTLTSKHHSTFNDYFFGFFLLVQLISLPIFSLVFFVIVHAERQNQTASWVYRLPVRVGQWYVAKFLTAWVLCQFVLFVSLVVSGFVLYWYAVDGVDKEAVGHFLGQYVSVSSHLLLLTVPAWITFFVLSFLIRTSTVAVLILLVLQVLTGFNHYFPNPFSTLRLAIGYASASGPVSYRPELQAQYLIAGVYILLLILAVWLYSRWRPSGLVHRLLN